MRLAVFVRLDDEILRGTTQRVCQHTSQDVPLCQTHASCSNAIRADCAQIVALEAVNRRPYLIGLKIEISQSFTSFTLGCLK